MRTGLDFKSPHNLIKSETKPRTEIKGGGGGGGYFKSSPVRTGGFEMTSHTNESLLKVR